MQCQSVMREGRELCICDIKSTDSIEKLWGTKAHQDWSFHEFLICTTDRANVVE